jgi:putative thioredoxin
VPWKEHPVSDPYGVPDLSSFKQPAAGGGTSGQPGAHELALTEANLEQTIADSQQVATLLVVTSTRVPDLDEFLDSLRRHVEAQAGAVRLATVDADTEPRVTAALRVQQLPTLLLLVKGQIQPVVEGSLPDAEVKNLVDQVVQVAQQQGLDVPAADGGEEEQTEPAPELPPLVQKAYDAIQAGDLAQAESAYQEHLVEHPADAEAKAGLASVHLMQRTEGADLDAARAAAAQAPSDLDAQLRVADLDMLGGHVDDAFGRLLDLLRGADQDTKDTVRTRLLELFEVAGPEDPRVAPARKRLANLLF